MNTNLMQKSIDFLSEHWHLITDDETRYKLEGANAVRPLLEEVLQGEKVRVAGGRPLRRSLSSNERPAC